MDLFAILVWLGMHDHFHQIDHNYCYYNKRLYHLMKILYWFFLLHN
uniref:Uncharacterized protein n=1 Tax=Schistosoma curassoni TaxID=6186 RepID=A0A183KGG6_9TREM